jgi:NAD(P)-dependent dehydrogenase (short-subunit alcohol dehydrogenase family)
MAEWPGSAESTSFLNQPVTKTTLMTAPSSSSSKNLVWFITGTSQGFGNELVRAALRRGDFVVATSRHPEKVAAAFKGESERLLAIPLDLRSEAAISTGVEGAIKRFGRMCWSTTPVMAWSARLKRPTMLK